MGGRASAFDFPLRGDLKMLGMALQGKMAEEVARLHPTEECP